MLFFSFPRVGSRAQAYRDTITGELPSLDQVLAQVPEGERVTALSLTTLEGRPIFRLTTDQHDISLTADTLLSPVAGSGVGFSHILDQAGRWSDAPIASIDTLYRLDTWIPYSSLQKHFPIYKIKYDDPQKSLLYLSSQSGEALQFCTRSERIQGALSTIPHMLYFWQLRQNRDLWLHIVSLLAGLSAILCLTGIIIGFQRYRQQWKRRGKIRSPYQKRWHRWHHQWGMVFGFFAMMFALSGLLSMNPLPRWIIPQHDPKLRSAVRKSDPIEVGRFTDDYRTLLALGEVKEITFRQYGTTPYYEITYGDRTKNFAVGSPTPTPLFLTDGEVIERLSNFVSEPMEIELLQEYDQYYVSNSGRAELPIYRIKAMNRDKSWFYVSPTTGYTRYYGTNERVKKWIYPAFHSLRTKFFAEHPSLRVASMLLLTLGGLVISLSGLVMGYQLLRRKLHRKRKSPVRQGTPH